MVYVHTRATFKIICSLLQIYDITSASTFFGVKEFVTMKCLCEEVSKLDSKLLLDGFENLNFTTLTTIVIQYTVSLTLSNTCISTLDTMKWGWVFYRSLVYVSENTKLLLTNDQALDTRSCSAHRCIN